MERSLLTGWGRTNPTSAWIAACASDEDVREALLECSDRGVIARGLGRSYGDAAQNSGGHVLRLDRDSVADVDDPTTVCVSGGTSLDTLLRAIVPKGFFVPVTPGTRYVTVGGAVAADVHGKNHHVDGTFGNHVVSLRLLLADGSIAEVGPDRNPALFWATVGGMGLTGIVLDATIRLVPIQTSLMSVDTTRVANLDTMFALMGPTGSSARYSVAWLDLSAQGRSLGRGVLTTAEHASIDDLPAGTADPLAYSPRARVSVPGVVPVRALNHATIRCLNEAWFRKSPTSTKRALQTIAAYFHPLDGIGSWNRAYGRTGFVQYQVVVPLGAETAMGHVIEHLTLRNAPSFVSVLKRFGPQNKGYLSFPMPGWTLAVDIPAATPNLAATLAGADSLVLAAGGRHYLAKDAHMPATAVALGYPRLAEWQRIQASVDPHGIWQSDLARRLRLLDRTTSRSNKQSLDEEFGSSENNVCI